MKQPKLSRRQFLKGAGNTLVAVPLLTSLLPEAVRAQAVPKKRFIAMAYDNGRLAEQWYPSMATDAGLRAVNGVPFMREMMLRNIGGNISQVFDSNFDGAIRDQLLLLRGLDGFWRIPSSDHVHRTSSVLAGTTLARAQVESDGAVKGSSSIDYVLANNSKSNSQSANSNSYLNLGAHYMGANISFRYSAGKMTPVGRESNPLVVFNRLFSNVQQPQQTVNDRPKKVVDLVLEHYRQVVGSRKISTSDRNLLQEHMDTLSELERSIASLPPPPPACVKPGAPRGGEAPAGNSYEVERVLNLHVEIMAAAVKCGIVNVGTIQTGDCTDSIVYENLGLSNTFHDGYSHNSDNSKTEILKITRFQVGLFAKLVKLLNVEESGTGTTYLQNSLLMHGNVHGHGNRHEYIDMPVMLAGSLGGRVRSGRYIDYSDRSRTQKSQPYYPPIPWGRTYNSLLVTILQAMGLSPTDYQQGNVAAGFGDDTIDGRYGTIESWRNQRNSPLPGIIV